MKNDLPVELRPSKTLKQLAKHYATTIPKVKSALIAARFLDPITNRPTEAVMASGLASTREVPSFDEPERMVTIPIFAIQALADAGLSPPSAAQELAHVTSRMGASTRLSQLFRALAVELRLVDDDDEDDLAPAGGRCGPALGARLTKLGGTQKQHSNLVSMTFDDPHFLGGPFWIQYTTSKSAMKAHVETINSEFGWLFAAARNTPKLVPYVDAITLLLEWLVKTSGRR